MEASCNSFSVAVIFKEFPLLLTVLDAFLAISEDVNFNFFQGIMPLDPLVCLAYAFASAPHSKIFSAGPVVQVTTFARLKCGIILLDCTLQIFSPAD